MASTRDVVPGFGAAVRAQREAAGLSLRDLAERAGTTAGAVSLVERGDRAPSLRMAAALAAALGVGLDPLLEESRNFVTD